MHRLLKLIPGTLRTSGLEDVKAALADGETFGHPKQPSNPIYEREESSPYENNYEWVLHFLYRMSNENKKTKSNYPCSPPSRLVFEAVSQRCQTIKKNYVQLRKSFGERHITEKLERAALPGLLQRRWRPSEALGEDCGSPRLLDYAQSFVLVAFDDPGHTGTSCPA